MDDTVTKAAQRTDHRGSAGEVFATFLKLGLTSFGGPIAHLGYFRDELVVRRRWIDERGYADLVALCQFLPGPASSQTGFALGLLRAGPLGAAAAWAAFTLPSAILLVLFGFGAASFGAPIGSGVIHGLKVVAVAIVAQAVWGMARNLCPDRERASVALAAVLIVVLVSGSVGQLAAIVVGGLAGLLLCRRKGEAITGHVSFPVSHSVGGIALVLFFGLLFGLPIAAAITSSQGLAVFDAFYRAGACLRRRARRPAAPAGGGRPARLGDGRSVPRWIRRGTGGAGAAVHLRRLPRSGAWPRAQRPDRSRRRGYRDFPARLSAADRHHSVLGCISHEACGAGADARSQRGGGGRPRSRALPARLDQRDRWPARICARPDLRCPSHVLEVPALDRGGRLSHRGRAYRLRLISTSGWRRARSSPDVVATGSKQSLG
ncbi:chromate transport protein ChrA (plasmid) [Sinorhizobium americanum]|uniref:Chromate transport protein ChrA n=1 Tax=Sinorhizobium americanum TaxID=194963 RepID=A0A1L3LU58_9HYPH|nr:chromate transport protein ChrA [Sinorhizobium americanum]